MKEHTSPNGEIQGDSRAIPHRGTMTGVTDTYGADLGQDATNGMGRITSATKSDPMFNPAKPSPTV